MCTLRENQIYPVDRSGQPTATCNSHEPNRFVIRSIQSSMPLRHPHFDICINSVSCHMMRKGRQYWVAAGNMPVTSGIFGKHPLSCRAVDSCLLWDTAHIRRSASVAQTIYQSTTFGTGVNKGRQECAALLPKTVWAFHNFPSLPTIPQSLTLASHSPLSDPPIQLHWKLNCEFKLNTKHNQQWHDTYTLTAWMQRPPAVLWG